MRTAEYTDSGKVIHRSIESAVRTNVLTGVNLTVSQQTLENAKNLGVELFAVSAHLGARPDHEAWQGGIYTSDQLRTVCRLGEPDGLCGINCRHSYYPYIQGAPRLYSNGELDELKAARMSYTDKSGNKRTVTRYEAEQKLRGIERNVRKYKRIASAQEAAGSDNTAARIKIGEWQQAARDFCEQTGLRRDYAREYIGVERSLWNTTGAHPKALALPSTKATEQKDAATKTEVSSDVEEATKKAMAALVDNPKSAAREALERAGVQARKAYVFTAPKTESEIIARIAGGDMTEGGSCSSVANAYIANKGGFDVLDFRDGESKMLFALKSTSLEMAKFNGVESVIKTGVLNQIKAGREMLELVETGKEYKLGVGRHAAIVRKLANGQAQYLELQINVFNGWKNFEKKLSKKDLIVKSGVNIHNLYI